MPKPPLRLPSAPTTNPLAAATKQNKAEQVVKLPNQAVADKSSAKSESVAHWSPSLQNVLEQPPAAFPRQLLIGGLVFCLAFIGWAWLGKIEQVGHARGRLIPRGEAYRIHPLDFGKVVQINVKEGQNVKAGQVLVQLDTQVATTEVERLKQMLEGYQNELRQKQRLSEKTRQQANTQSMLAKATIQVQDALLDAAQTKVITLREVLAQMQKEKAASQTRVSRLEPLTNISKERTQQLQSDIAAHQERVKRLKKLADDGAIAREYLFQAEQALRDRAGAITENELTASVNTEDRLFEAQNNSRDRAAAITQQQGELKQALVEIQSLHAQMSQKIAEANINQLQAQQQIGQLEVEKTQLQAQIAETQTLLNQARTQLVQKFLYAPVNGIVSSLNVRNVGEVVQQGQTIAEVAPITAPLVLSASLPNQEAGFVKLGMPVQVKLDAFPYQDFGVVTGKVTSISPDTKQEQGSNPVYQVEVTLDRSYVTANQQTVSFKAGQTATADIIIRRRRIIDVLLDPLKQLQKGGMDL